MFWTRRTTRSTTLIATGAAVALTASACGGVTDGTTDADDYPNENIRLTVGQEAGGSTDLIARAIADEAQSALGTSMTVENQPGANGAIATQDVASQEPDGYELVLLNASLITVTSLVVDEDEEVTLDDLDIVAGLSQDDYIMVANADSDIETVEDMVQADRTISYGTTGVGTASQLAQLLLMEEADIAGNEVPFDSGAPAMTAVMGDQVEVATVQVGEAMPQIEAGTVKPIVVFSEDRIDYLSDVPTAVEEGYEIPISQYRALALPAGAPDEVIETLREGLEEVFASEDYQQFNEEHFLTPAELDGEEVEEQWTEYAELYAELVEENDIDLGGDD
ncbi:Bug family tripartite tricarboxylate transporter substrate binding protein [Nesterenkonia cremea]|uniref:ABC transporter substrate-binding protein n=1 Tax=Nesterenkonia cremea TaxID=1882340 RepID=A0A917ALN5_9MICC|nr:tripartite tricarboxylate transporter substrate binding protein [Nesterenkonia cremea]GGE57439.1 ABC transporter substrate-binding protein [Nesterenkonia cremea]